MKHGIGLTAGSDTEVIVHLLAHTPPDIVEDDGPNWPARFNYLILVLYLDLTYTSYLINTHKLPPLGFPSTSNFFTYLLLRLAMLIFTIFFFSLLCFCLDFAYIYSH